MTSRKFPVSPVELCIFCVISLLFLNSVVDLFYDIRTNSTAPMAKPPGTIEVAQSTPEESGTGRSPASIRNMTYETVAVGCETTLLQAGAEAAVMDESKINAETQARRVRLSGKICGIQVPEEVKSIVSTEVVNRSNDYNATIFTDSSSGTYQTEYFSLNDGSNPIDIKFNFQNGKSTHQRFMIYRGQKRKL